jgi:hypothetical protein
MAIFCKEPYSTKSRETVKTGDSIDIFRDPRGPDRPSRGVHLPSRTPGPVAQRADLRAYLHKGSNISAKLYFEGAAEWTRRWTGKSARITRGHGETPVVTAWFRAASAMVWGQDQRGYQRCQAG